jgi:hypothetical protein
VIPLLLAAQLTAALPTRSDTRSAADTIVVERVFPPRPHVVQARKLRRLERGEFFNGILSRLTASGFFQLSSEAIADACGRPGATVKGLTIRVHDETGSRQLELPDGCQPSSQSLDAQLAELRNIAWDALGENVVCPHR